MNDNDDPFKRMVDIGEDESAVDELEFELNQIRGARPDSPPENLDADGLVGFDREVVTNISRPLSVDESFNEYLLQAVETVTRMNFLTNPYHHHHKMKLIRQLKS